jgi:hypothetical protein
MYFDEGRDLSHPQYREPEGCNSINPAKQLHEIARPGRENHGRLVQMPLPAAGTKAGDTLDSANNKMQELMQLLYLLSRDPAVPNDARYHVTMAQSEIALLARVMKNNTEDEQGGAAAADQNASANP